MEITFRLLDVQQFGVKPVARILALEA